MSTSALGSPRRAFCRQRMAPALVTVMPLLLMAGCARVNADSAGNGGVTVNADSHADGLYGTDVSDVIKRPVLTLRDTAGQQFDLRDRPDSEVTVLFFGYTNCADVCPTTMADLAAARRQLRPADDHRILVAFVTEDPTRDTPEVLRTWLDRFDTSFVGLIGGGTRTRDTLDALKAPRTEVASHAPAGHTGAQHQNGERHDVEHTGSVYAFVGDRTVVYTGGTTPKEYAADFASLLRRR